MILSVHQPQYLPWLGFFHKIYKSDVFVFLDDVQYKHREFQNRNRILTKTGPLWLTVPVITNKDSYPNLQDVLIDNSQGWAQRHYKTLCFNYSQAPFFKKYGNFFEEVYNRKWERLIDLNIFIIEYLLKTLGIKTPVEYSSRLKIKTAATERIIDICNKFKADTYLSGAGGKDYLEEDKFKASAIKLVYQDFKHPVYQQLNVQGKDFVPYLSVVDLIFNHDPESLKILTGG
jgi:hypothetical protein